MAEQRLITGAVHGLRRRPWRGGSHRSPRHGWVGSAWQQPAPTVPERIDRIRAFSRRSLSVTSSAAQNDGPHPAITLAAVRAVE
jgi:hypothetical protein